MIENSLAKFEEHEKDLIDFNNQPLTETDTRCKIIDFIFKSILGWKESNISREKHVHDGFIDYVFTSDSNTFLIEAKKTGYFFNLPTKVRKLKRTGVLATDSTINEALAQAYTYCRSNNIKVGCICNGLQFIVFLINNFNNKYDTYVFKDINDIKTNFITFYNIFSPHSFAEDSLINLLDSNNDEIRTIPQYKQKLNDVIFNPNERISRNPIDPYIRPLIGKYFSDLIEGGKEQLLDECYCTAGRSGDYEAQLTSLIVDSLPRLELPVQDSSFFSEDFISKQEEFKRLFKNSDVMIIVGGVGAGKTTFIHRYFKKTLPETIRKNVVWLCIDFIKHSSEEINVREFILKECLQQIREKYSFLQIDTWETLQDIYRADIIRLQNGALKPLFRSNKTEYDQKISSFLTDKVNNEIQFAEDALKYLSRKQDKKKVICLTIDNADQLTENFQKKCVTAAFEFSSKIKSLILLSMREESYWRIRNIKPFDAYRGYAYHIAAPSVNELLSKRINILKTHLSKEDISILDDTGKRCIIKLPQLMDILSNSLLYNDNAVLTLFQFLAANNLRFALDMFSTFLTSGHTNTREYIVTYLTGGDYIIPYHAFVRSICLGDYKYYHSDKSLVMNLFEIDNDGFYSHFNKLRILHYLKDRINIDCVAGKGFIEVDELFHSFTDVCNSNKSFRETLTPLLNNHLIEADNGYRISGQEASYIKLTSAGYYYITTLLFEFAYLERLCEDTPIKSKEHFEELEQLTNKINREKHRGTLLGIRIERVKAFLRYLLREENEEEEFILNPSIKLKFIEPIITTIDNKYKNKQQSLF